MRTKTETITIEEVNKLDFSTMSTEQIRATRKLIGKEGDVYRRLGLLNKANKKINMVTVTKKKRKTL